MHATTAISVVIPTLGGDCLKATIERLNAGVKVPDEILICIPADYAQRVAHYEYPNVRVVSTECKGQVAQRAIGFREARQDLVVQLDDDILVDERCIQILVHALGESGPKAAVAPSLFCTSSRESFYKSPSRKRLLHAYYWLLNGGLGYRPGNITKAGTNVGVDPAVSTREVIEVDWVPGGCVLHRRENLILENFYPFPGKAFCEDIIHSHYLKVAGVRLLVSTKAVCWVECVRMQTQRPREFVRNLIADYRARRFFVRLTSRSFSRMLVYYIINLFRYAYLRTFSAAR